MKLRILAIAAILLSITAAGSATTFYVPSRGYPTIQSGINAAADGDEVVVAPGIYTGFGNNNLDCHGKAVTVRSAINPENPDWEIIEATVIDCGGKPVHRTNSDNGAANRAFWFRSGEGPSTVVAGFTIRNGYARGPKGEDGTLGQIPPVPYDECRMVGISQDWFCEPPEPHDDFNGPPRAEPGHPAAGHGYGGAILCENGSSPTIKYCVIEDCTVTGAEGGRGANGVSAPWQYFEILAYVDYSIPGIDLCGDPCEDMDPIEMDAGQCGGHGGDGTGNGFGAAIACKEVSSPTIADCIFRNSVARGGVGGDGGDGGSASGDPNIGWEGYESAGGDAGWGFGDGWGGVIYAVSGSNPVVANCTFEENAATTGIGGEGGARGPGNETIPRAEEGLNGFAIPNGYISGGVAYFNNLTNASFTNCTFAGNETYEVSIEDQVAGVVEPAKIYTVGGALYFWGNSNVNLNNCDFTNNSGGAVYFGNDCNIVIHNSYDPNRTCLFSGNSDPNDNDELYMDRGIDFGAGGAMYIGKVCTVNLRGCNFAGNLAKNEGGALMSKSDVSLTDCSFSNNTAGNYGGAMDVFYGTLLTLDFNDCSFVGNQGKYGGAISSEVYAATFTDCYLSNNTAEIGGALHLASGVVEIAGGGISGNVATGGGGGGMYCQLSEARISNCTIQDNSAYGISGSGGGVNFAGAAAVHVVKNCLLTGNYAATNGGAIFCSNATPEIENCTFFGNGAAGNGGAIFADWSSFASVTNCILSNCSSHAIHEEDFTGDAVVTHSLFYNNTDGDYYDAGTGTTYTGPDGIGNIPGGSNNIYGDSLFVTGPSGGFYLSQIAAGQSIDSPAIDAGSDTSANLGMSAFTTRTDEASDEGMVDIGYHYPVRGATDVNLAVGFEIDEYWMYQNLPGQGNSDLTASISVTDDPMGNTTYSYAWEIVLPGDVSLAPVTVDGGGAGDAYWTLAARGCDEPGGLSDSGQTFTVRVRVTGDDYGNTGQAEAEFGIALLGDVNNDGVVDVADRAIVNGFWRTGSAGPFSSRDCDLNCDGDVELIDRVIANAVWRGALGQDWVSNPCPLR